jgi:hypothetical protein
MKTTGPRRDPDFLGNRVTIDDDLAAVGKLDFQDATRCQFEVEIGLASLKRCIDPG